MARGDLLERHGLRVAVLLPCYNEEVAIASTVQAFRRALPQATVYVYDNDSSDRTAEVAEKAGAVVRREKARGKGNVVRRMFADIEADYFILADGDATYDANAAPDMLQRAVSLKLDMVVGCRIHQDAEAYRPGHRFGNWALTSLLMILFGRSFTDILSGYRVLSRRFVKSFPAFATGFETETEMSIHALRVRAPVGEVETAYFVRPAGSSSKLSTLLDGWRILWTITNLLRQEKPLLFFTVAGFSLAALSLGLAAPLFLTYLETGRVPRLPTAVLSASLGISAFLSISTGLVLDTVVRGRQEVLRLAYLLVPILSPPEQDESGENHDRVSPTNA